MLKKSDLTNKVCLVTGAAGLMGGQFADALLEAGARVCLLDINDKALRNKERLLKKKYHDRCWRYR